jgi:cardiolipin synthase
MWLAHALTLSRIPIAVVFWLTYGQSRWLSLGLVVLAALTDAADGNLARYAKRRTGSTSTLGEWLDPAADKLFIIGVLGAIQVHDPVPWAIIALIVARELVVIPLATFYRFVVHGRGKHAFQAGVVGKAATVAEFLAIVAIIMHSPALVPLALAAAGLGLGAVVLYIVRATHPHERAIA